MGNNNYGLSQALKFVCAFFFLVVFFYYVYKVTSLCVSWIASIFSSFRARDLSLSSFFDLSVSLSLSPFLSLSLISEWTSVCVCVDVDFCSWKIFVFLFRISE